MHRVELSPRWIRFMLAGLALSAVLIPPLATAAPPPKPEIVSLWPDQAPIGEGKTQAAQVPLTVHFLSKEKANGAAMVICPGGGYGGRVVGAEGHGIADWLNRHGIAGCVLEYRLPHGNSTLPLADAQRAIRTVRARAKTWNIDPDRIGIIGFSAGGHLASTAGTHFDRGNPQAADPVERLSCRPDFMVLVYPVVTMGEKTHRGSRDNLLGKNPSAELIERFSNERQVTDDTPPAYLAHAQDDRVVPPVHSLSFYEAMKAHNRTAEYLSLPEGGHGLNGYKGPMWDRWQAGSLQWLARLKIITEAAAN